MTNLPICPGCSGYFPDIKGPSHACFDASSGCWARFGQMLAFHYSDARYWPAHQILMDAYSLQHSRDGDRSSIRSAHIHLAALYAQIELRQSEARVIALRRTLSGREFKRLHSWPSPTVSIADVELADPECHLMSVTAFARGVLSDWSPYEEIAKRLCQT